MKTREEINEARRVNYAINKEKIAETRKRYYQRPDVKERIKEQSKKFYDNNQERCRQVQQQYRITQQAKNLKSTREKKYRQRFENRINENVRHFIRFAIINKKEGNWRNLVGYTVFDLLKHLELLFKPGMTWENYGSYWEIDHIKPRSSFKFCSTDDEQFKQCWDLSNLRPLTVLENLTKGTKIIDDPLVKNP